MASPSSASLCWRLWRRLRDSDEIQAVSMALGADLDALEADLCAAAQRHRALRRPQPPPQTPGSGRKWTPAQKAAMASRFVELRANPARFADALVKAGVDADLADSFANDMMADADPTSVVASVHRHDPDAGRHLARAVLERVPVAHLDEVVRDVVASGLDLFDESAADAVAFVGAACERIVRATLAARIPDAVARLAAALDDPLQVVFVDWIAAALKKRGRYDDVDDGSRARAMINRIVVADNLAALIAARPHPPPAVETLRPLYDAAFAAFAQRLQYAAPAPAAADDDGGVPDLGDGVWAVRTGDMARLAGDDGESLSSSADYVMLRRGAVPAPDSDGDDGRSLVAYLRRRPALVECPNATLMEQLGADGAARRLVAVLRATTPPDLARDDFRPLLVRLLQRYDTVRAPAEAIAAVARQLQAARGLLQARRVAVADTEALARARPVINAIRARSERFVADLLLCDGVCCDEAGADGAFVCAPCRRTVLARARALAQFTQNALAAARQRHGPALADGAVADRVRGWIRARAASVPAPACAVFGRVLERLAGAYPDLAGFRAAFGGPVRPGQYADGDFDDAAAGAWAAIGRLR